MAPGSQPCHRTNHNLVSFLRRCRTRPSQHRTCQTQESTDNLYVAMVVCQASAIGYVSVRNQRRWSLLQHIARDLLHTVVTPFSNLGRLLTLWSWSSRIPIPCKVSQQFQEWASNPSLSTGIRISGLDAAARTVRRSAPIRAVMTQVQLGLLVVSSTQLIQ